MTEKYLAADASPTSQTRPIPKTALDNHHAKQRPIKSRSGEAAEPYIDRLKAGEPWFELYNEARTAIDGDIAPVVCSLIYAAEQAIARELAAPYIAKFRGGESYFDLFDALEIIAVSVHHCGATEFLRRAAIQSAKGNKSLQNSYLQHCNPKSFFAWRRTNGGNSDRSRLSGAFLAELWDKQDGICALTGWKMTLDRRPRGNICNASIDCITPQAKGGVYEPGNVQLVCDFANVARRDRDADDFRAQWRAGVTRSSD